MKSCEQTAGQSVYQHGISVYEYFNRIVKGEHEGLRIPDWFYLYQDDILANLHSEKIIKDYTIYHDCGKPFCREIDENGRVHFPNHAEVSASVYTQIKGNAVVAKLIGWDMCLHTMTAEQIEQMNWNVNDAMTLMVAAFAEIHSNANLFGGISSLSFKAKWKQLERRGKQLCKHYFRS